MSFGSNHKEATMWWFWSLGPVAVDYAHNRVTRSGAASATVNVGR